MIIWGKLDLSRRFVKVDGNVRNGGGKKITLFIFYLLKKFIGYILRSGEEAESL